MSIRYARQLEDVMQALDPRQLHSDELQDFFEETKKARDPKTARREELYRYLREEGNIKALVAGHAGTGKSTELVKFQAEHENEFLFVVASPVKEMITSGLSIESLLILIVECVVRGTKANGVELGKATIEAVYQWFSKEFSISEDDLKYGVEAGAGLDARKTLWDLLLGVVVYLKGDIRMGSHKLHQVITEKNKRLSELASMCNLLIREAKLAVRNDTRKELALIIEDLDKIPLQEADDIFIKNPGPLADLDCKAIYTLPIWILWNPRSNVLDPLFSKVTIPMIKVCHQNMDPCEEGCQALKRIVHRRIEPGLIDEDALELAIKQTGGVIRHLFEVLRTAALAAGHAVEEGRDRHAIMAQDVRYGLDRKKDDLVRSIGTIGLPEEFKSVKMKDLLDRLRDLAQNPRKLESDPISMLLLGAHAVIEYNGQGWNCVHPLVAEHLENS